MVDTMAMGHVSKYFGFPLSISFQHCSILLPSSSPRVKRCVAALPLSKIEGVDHKVTRERSLNGLHTNSHAIQVPFFKCICSMVLSFAKLKYDFCLV
jgi:hypothetical protein